MAKEACTIATSLSSPCRRHDPQGKTKQDHGQPALTAAGEEAGGGLRVGSVYAADGVPRVLDAVHEVEVDSRRVSALRGKAGLAGRGPAERRDLPDFASASVHAKAGGAIAGASGGTGQHRGAGRKCGRASCSER